MINDSIFKDEYSNGVINLTGTGIAREDVIITSNQTEGVLLTGNYDWGYSSSRSRDMAYHILVEVLKDPQRALKAANNLDAAVIAYLNPLKFDIQLNLKDLMIALGQLDSELSNDSTSKSLHAFSFFGISISKEEELYVSKFLDLPHIGSKKMYPIHNSSIQGTLLNNMDTDTLEKYKSFVSRQEVGVVEAGRVSSIKPELIKLESFGFTGGTRSEDEANKIVLKYDEVYLSKQFDIINT